MSEIFGQLAELLVHLGEKRIATLHLGTYEMKFDTTTLIMSWIVIALIVVVALLLRRGLRQPVEEKPNRTQAMLESLIGLLKSQLADNFGSEKLAAAMFPFVSAIFLYVLFSNWISIIPYATSPTQDLNVTLGMALMVFVVSQVLSIRSKGWKKYLRAFAEPIPVMLPMNVLGELAKPLSHAFRLFGNILAGTILITVVMVKFVPIVVPPVLTLIFGMFFGGIQAFVFAMLAVAYINVAVE